MKNKENKEKHSPINLKINTRIVLSSVCAIIIPALLILSFSTIFINMVASYFNFSSVTTNSYSIVNQVQWSQTITNISDELVSNDTESAKLKRIKEFVSPLENINSNIYIECNDDVFYSTSSNVDVLKEAEKITSIDTDKNSFFFGESGVVIITHAKSNDKNYLLLITNDDYVVQDASIKYTAQNLTSELSSKTCVIIGIVAGIFVLAIIILSFITSKTIVKPIKKITMGANEIARGNLDYEIDYESSNELGQLAFSFNEMRLRLRKSKSEEDLATRQQQELIAGIAHDLRTPLTSVKGYVEGLRDGIADTPEKQNRYLETIYSSTCDTEKMLDDLLTISKLELHDIELNYEDVTVSDMVSFIEEIGKDVENSNFDFSIFDNTRTNPVLRIDTDRFSRVINNIISNSIKYKRDDIRGKIIITFSEYEKSIIMEIADNGMGVEKENLHRIFDTLYRADKARTNVRNGSGLGLSVSKHIVEMHGGMIWAKSKVGEGLSILISLPIKEEKT